MKLKSGDAVGDFSEPGCFLLQLQTEGAPEVDWFAITFLIANKEWAD